MESRKRVYSEAFGGEWTQSEYHEVDDNSDDGWDDTGWCSGIVVKTGYSWEWKFDDLIACEAEMQNELAKKYWRTCARSGGTNKNVACQTADQVG